MADHASYAYDYLRRKLRLTPAQAAGAVGGMTGESGRNLDPNAVNPTSGALGIAQWLGARAQGVKKGDFEGQLAHLVAELQGPEAAALKRLRGTHTIEDSTRAWMEGFERPSPAEMASSFGGRVANARDIFKQLQGHPVMSQQMNTAGVPGSTLASAAAAPAADDQMSTLSTILKRLDPKPVQTPTDQPKMGLERFGLQGYTPPSLSDTVAQLQQITGNKDAAVDTPTGPAAQGGATSDPSVAPGGPGSASGAVAYAQSKLGHFKENRGSNRGTELDQLQQKFGMLGQPWCAMFATTAAVQGGASKDVRTASVAQINQWASEGSHGFQRGLVDDRHAVPGSLITFGNDHVGLVVGRNAKGVETIEGNNSNGQVNRRFHPYGSGRIARPVYGR